MKKIRLMDIKEHISADTLSKRKGIYTARLGYFYSRGKSAEDFAKQIKSRIPEVNIIDYGDVWKTFRGGASVGNQTHWWVKFTIN